MKVRNISNGPRGFNAVAGTVFLEAGETSDDVEMVDGEIASAESTGYFEISGKAAPAKEPAAPVYTVKDKGAGWFAVFDGDEPVTKAMRKAEIELFDAMTDDEKAAFVEANKAD